MSDVETPEYAGMLSRMIRAYSKRVGDGDPAVRAERYAHGVLRAVELDYLRSRQGVPA